MRFPLSTLLLVSGASVALCAPLHPINHSTAPPTLEPIIFHPHPHTPSSDIYKRSIRPLDIEPVIYHPGPASPSSPDGIDSFERAQRQMERRLAAWEGKGVQKRGLDGGLKRKGVVGEGWVSGAVPLKGMVGKRDLEGLGIEREGVEGEGWVSGAVPIGGSNLGKRDIQVQAPGVKGRGWGWGGKVVDFAEDSEPVSEGHESDFKMGNGF